jgi:2-polyprenyl-3-methyl-5-hydroxy-6-metoxy-1,4-benzoquinol methylase
MTTRADVFGDAPELRFPPGTVDEIRSHHLFEHFPRVEALALLVRWQEWLRPGGRLVIETPDLEGSARTLLSEQPLEVKMGVVRHLAGDQSEGWAFHVDQWFPARFRHTLGQLGFGDVQVEQRSWPHPPFLSDVAVTATKTTTLSREALLARSDGLLAQSMVAAEERPTLERWRAQLRSRLAGGPVFRPALGAAQDPVPAAAAPAAAPPAPGLETWLAAYGSRAPLAEIVDFNQRARDRWVAERAASIPPGARVLDVGAGTCPYRSRFAHCEYVAHDFKRYEGVKLGGGTDYGRIDLVGDVTSIAAPDASFDVVLCTEVLEHVPRPNEAVGEMARLLKPGGRLLLTAPLGSGLHQLPFHYYGGFSPEWYRELARRHGLEIVTITPNGGFFKLLAQETARAADLLAQAGGPQRPPGEVLQLLGEILPRWFFALDEQLFVDQFTVGYFVEARRAP